MKTTTTQYARDSSAVYHTAPRADNDVLITPACGVARRAYNRNGEIDDCETLLTPPLVSARRFSYWTSEGGAVCCVTAALQPRSS